MPRSLSARSPGGRALLVAVVWACLGSVPAARAAKTIDEAILEGKYRRGDYGIYVGAYRPNDWKFREHAELAYPIGLTVRFRLGDESWRSRLRLEGNVSYYRRSEEPVATVSIAQQPGFDGLTLGASVQAILPKLWFLRPYVGGGAMFVSLSNDFLVFRPEIYEIDPDNTAQYALASWKKSDIGWQILAGLDIPLGMRAFPFVEYRQTVGVVAIAPEDVTIGGLSLPVLGGTIETPPEFEDRDEGGMPYDPQYDWGGPEVMLGLKILF